VTDALMLGMGGIALLERLKAENRGLPAIMITGHRDIAMAIQAIKAAAWKKPVRPDELLTSIGRALERIRDSGKLLEWRKTASERIARLTPPNKIIAHDLGISQRTVENHRSAVMKRTGVASLPDLIRLVMAAADRPPDSA
jgi:two-component system CheB/CheR fusion protein